MIEQSLLAAGRRLVAELDRRNALQTWFFAVLDENEKPDDIHKLLREFK